MESKANISEWKWCLDAMRQLLSMRISNPPHSTQTPPFVRDRAEAGRLESWEEIYNWYTPCRTSFIMCCLVSNATVFRTHSVFAKWSTIRLIVKADYPNDREMFDKFETSGQVVYELMTKELERALYDDFLLPDAMSSGSSLE